MSPLNQAKLRRQNRQWFSLANHWPRIACNLLFVAPICTAPAISIAHPVTYRVTGTAHKGEISDNLYGSSSDPVAFEVTFTAEIEQAQVVPPGTKVSLPNAPEAQFTETGYLLPAASLSSFSFSLASGMAPFSLSNVITDPGTGGVVFLTGSLRQPTSINMTLANAASGILQIGIPNCSRTCSLQGGLVLDSGGPFGTLAVDQITAMPRR